MRRGFSLVSSPEILRIRVHPLLSFASSSECLAADIPPFARTLWAPSWGSLSSSRCEPAESTCVGHPRPNSFRPQRFSRSRRFSPLLILWVCFIPQPRPGFALQGVSPPLSRSTSSVAVPSCCCFRPPANEQVHQFQLAESQLQGFDPFGDPFSRREGLVLGRLDPFLRFQLPRAFLRWP